MQNITGKPFDELLHGIITRPLGMAMTGLNAPERSRDIIPTGAGRVLWDFNFANFNMHVTKYCRYKMCV